MLERVLQARGRQKRRYAGTGIELNSRLGASNTVRYCSLGLAQQRYMERIAESMHLSARACHRILRVARTIADLDDSDRIEDIHLSEAVCYRSNELPGGEVR